MKQLRVIGSNDRMEPGMLYCLGRNYALHAREMGSDVPSEPMIFTKPPTAVISDGDAVVIPAMSKDLHHELELVVVLGNELKHVEPEEVHRSIFGYAIGLDMTMRDVQARAKAKGEPWAIAKGFDTSAPIGPIIPSSRVDDPGELSISLSKNGSVVQHGSLSDMIFSIPQILSYLSRIFTLRPGDCVFTGTPEGVGRVDSGDRLVARIDGYEESTIEVGVI